MSKEIRALIFQMVAENPTWGAPRMHGELLKLGFDLSEPTVSRWMRRAPRPHDPTQRWLTFLRNHREAIAAMDFFTLPTLTFGVLYCFFSSATTGDCRYAAIGGELVAHSLNRLNEVGLLGPGSKLVA